MATPVLMPKLGMSMAEGRVIEWLVDPAATVEKGGPLLLIETEKAEVEIEATTSGVLRHIYIEPGETVPCGTLLAAITENADSPFDADALQAEHALQRALVTAAPAAPTTPPADGSPAPRRDGPPVTPAARRRARDLDVDLGRVTGTGPRGRITAEDVEAWDAHRPNLVEVADGVSLEVLTDGTGDPVLLLPGFGTDVSMFAPQTAALTDAFQVIALNPRGVGQSDAPEEEQYDVPQAARDAAAVLDGPAHVIGASLGAAVALELALQRPDLARSLTLITPLVTASPRLRAVCDAWCAVAADSTPDTLARVMLPWFFSPDYLADEDIADRTARGLAHTLARVPAPTLRRAAAGMAAWSGTRETDLAQLSAPTLVVVADGDLLTPGGDAVAAAIPEAECVHIPVAGHAVCIEAPDAVNQALMRHLATCGVDAA